MHTGGMPISNVKQNNLRWTITTVYVLSRNQSAFSYVRLSFSYLSLTSSRYDSIWTRLIGVLCRRLEEMLRDRKAASLMDWRIAGCIAIMHPSLYYCTRAYPLMIDVSLDTRTWIHSELDKDDCTSAAKARPER
jgi:hypothetical protein